MKRKLEISELIFKILAYFLLTIFALCCLCPFVFAISSQSAENTMWKPIDYPASKDSISCL